MNAIRRHQSRDSIQAYQLTFIHQILMHPWRTDSPVAVIMDLSNARHKTRIVFIPLDGVNGFPGRNIHWERRPGIDTSCSRRIQRGNVESPDISGQLFGEERCRFA